jgi:hypothetical protein
VWRGGVIEGSRLLEAPAREFVARAAKAAPGVEVIVLHPTEGLDIPAWMGDRWHP